MTEQEYITKHTKYSKKAEYYRRKLLRLEAEYFEQINKDNKFLKVLAESEDKE